MKNKDFEWNNKIRKISAVFLLVQIILLFIDLPFIYLLFFHNNLFLKDHNYYYVFGSLLFCTVWSFISLIWIIKLTDKNIFIHTKLVTFFAVTSVILYFGQFNIPMGVILIIALVEHKKSLKNKDKVPIESSKTREESNN